MKQAYKVALLSLLIFISQGTSAQYYNGRVRIDSVDKSYLFQITDASTITNFHKFYFWFKSGRLHMTQGAYHGKLLHGDYKVIDSNRRLMEKGKFKNGIKKGRWLIWHTNGRIYSKMHPRFFGGGFTVKEYDSLGNLAKSGYNKNELFTGKEYSYINDSLNIRYYKDGLLLQHKPSFTIFKK